MNSAGQGMKRQSTVCVPKRERERERDGSVCERERWECVCVCVREREREYVCVCVRAYMRVYVFQNSKILLKLKIVKVVILPVLRHANFSRYYALVGLEVKSC